MAITLIIALVTVIMLTLSVLFFPKIKTKNFSVSSYWVICLFGALLMLIFKSITLEKIYRIFTNSSNVNPLKILVLFFSLTYLSIYLDEVGFFKILAIRAAKSANKNQCKLFIIFYFLTAFLTIFTSNDIVILTLTPFVCYFCKSEKINPLPYLVGEFAAANTWSMMLLIGNPTNIFLSSSSGIDFISYFKVMVLPTFAAGVIEFIIIYMIFYKQLKMPMHLQINKYEVKDKFGFILGVAHLIICLILMIVSSYLNFEMWIVSLCCAISLFIVMGIINLLRKHTQKELFSTIKRAPYALIPFVLSMFIIVASLNEQGISKKIAEILGSNAPTFVYGISSFTFANVMNNIPMSVLFSSLSINLNGIDYTKAIYSTIIGSNIGAFLTPIGALAGIMFTDLLNEHGVKYSFKDFIKYGIIIALPTLLVSLLTLELTLSF